MKIFVDTNIIIDYFSARTPFIEDAEKIFNLAKSDNHELCVSALSFTTIAYILRKFKSAEEVIFLLNELQKIMTVLPTNALIINKAIHSGFPDFEDAVQYFTAIEGCAEIIITHDQKGFISSEIPVLHPHHWK